MTKQTKTKIMAANRCKLFLSWHRSWHRGFRCFLQTINVQISLQRPLLSQQKLKCDFESHTGTGSSLVTVCLMIGV